MRGFSVFDSNRVFGDMFKPVDMTPKRNDLAMEHLMKIDAGKMLASPEPGLLRTLIEETRKSNQQSARLIEQNDLLLAGARSGGRISGWGLVFTIVGTATGVAGVIIAIIALTA